MVWDFGSPNDTIAEVHLSSATGLQQLKQLGNTGRALSTALAASAPTYHCWEPSKGGLLT